MADYFTDSSALVKRYVRETGSAWLSGLFDPSLNNEVFIVAITAVEIVAALTRRARIGTTTAADAAAACNQFRSDWLVDYQVVEVNDTLLSHAMTLAETYDPAFLEKLGVHGFVPDLAMAQSWYEKARALGSAEAPQRLETLASKRQ